MTYKYLHHLLAYCFIALVVFYSSPSSFAATDVKSIYVQQNSTLLTFCQGEVCRIVRLESTPEIQNKTMFVPLRSIAEELGATVQWNSKLGRIDIKKDNQSVQLFLGSSKVIQNGKSLQQSIKPYIKQGRTMVPLRFVSESLGYFVSWKGSPMEVRISSKKIPDNPW